MKSKYNAFSSNIISSKYILRKYDKLHFPHGYITVAIILSTG